MLGCLEGSESRSVYALRGLDGMKGSANNLQGNVTGASDLWRALTLDKACSSFHLRVVSVMRSPIFGVMFGSCSFGLHGRFRRSP
jgi:hypothetical protein